MDVLLGDGEMEEHISENERDKGGVAGGREKVKETRSIWGIFHPLNHEIEVLLSVLQVQRRTADGVYREAELVVVQAEPSVSVTINWSMTHASNNQTLTLWASIQVFFIQIMMYTTGIENSNVIKISDVKKWLLLIVKYASIFLHFFFIRTCW